MTDWLSEPHPVGATPWSFPPPSEWPDDGPAVSLTDVVPPKGDPQFPTFEATKEVIDRT